jgi:hypothetical protein
MHTATATNTHPADMTHLPTLSFVTGVSHWDVLLRNLARSPCLQKGQRQWTAVSNAKSAAEAFNPALIAAAQTASGHASDNHWLVWVHQDVYLPSGWDLTFAKALQDAAQRWPTLAVAGVYGVSGHGPHLQRSGHVLDRGKDLHEPTPLPALTDSLDELLVAVKVSSGLRMDESLGFDFYGTDLVLQAKAKGLQAAVLEAYCEHWSDTPSSWPLPDNLVQRISNNANAFEQKWQHALPLSTSCFDIAKPGDVARFLKGTSA